MLYFSNKSNNQGSGCDVYPIFTGRTIGPSFAPGGKRKKERKGKEKKRKKVSDHH